MDSTSTLQDLRAQAVAKAKSYFDLAKSKERFDPGKTYIPASGKVLTSEDLEALIEASLDLNLTAGRFATDLEHKLANCFLGKTSALLTNSGSSANLLALSALGSVAVETFAGAPLQKGDEVLTVAAGFPTTVNPIVQNGWTPVFVDIDKDTLNVDIEKLKAAKTSKTKAVVLAHTLGNPFRADWLRDWCQRENLFLVEDCCDALGAEIETEEGATPVGSFGEFATLSFYPAHHMTTGEGGAVLAKNQKWRRIAESLRDWGRDCWCEPGKDNTCGKRFCWKWEGMPEGYDHKYLYSEVGYNLKMTEMQAALGVSQLKKLSSFIQIRRQNWSHLFKAFRNSPVLCDRFVPVEATPHTKPSWFGFAIHCKPGVDRQKVTQALEENKIGTRLLFAGNLTKQRAYKNIEYKISGSLENTDAVMRDTFWVGVYPGIGPQHLSYMLEVFEKVAKSL